MPTGTAFVDLYTKLNPAKVGDVDQLLERFQEQEHILFAKIYRKYNVQASSSAILPTIALEQTKKEANYGGDIIVCTLHIQQNMVDTPAHQTAGTDHAANVLSAVRDMVFATNVDEVELRRRISLILAT